MKPSRNHGYLRFIRRQPCCVCGRSWGGEASHTGPHGLGQKSPDESCIPLCWIHHRGGRDSYHNLGRVRFSETHNLDILAIIFRLTSEHESKNSSREFMGQVARLGPAPPSSGK
jgi:hypothetical protein